MKNKLNRPFLVVLLILSLTIAIIGCTTTTTGLSSTTSTSGTTSTTASTGKGTLNLTDSGPVTLDPATAAEAGSASYILQIFGGLVQLDDKLQIAPDIAQSWDKSSDGLTYTFHLRKDVKFHDGKAVTANDFK